MTDEHFKNMIVFISRDGKRIPVSRAIATTASLVLCDLLDGQESTYTTTDEDLSSAEPHLPGDISSGSDADIQDSVTNHNNNSNDNSKPVNPLDALFDDNVNDNGKNSSNTSALQNSPPPVAPEKRDKKQNEVHVVELPFPYLPTDILEKVVMHMKYRFRTSVFGAEGNYLRVFPIPVRDIPRPMVLPLMEYLDSKDRLFVSDWDEITTVWMVKAATFLNYELLWQLASAKLTSLLKEKGVDSIRTLFGVENADFSPMEEAELRKEQPDEYAK